MNAVIMLRGETREELCDHLREVIEVVADSRLYGQENTQETISCVIIPDGSKSVWHLAGEAAHQCLTHRQWSRWSIKKAKWIVD